MLDVHSAPNLDLSLHPPGVDTVGADQLALIELNFGDEPIPTRDESTGQEWTLMRQTKEHARA